MMATGKVGYNGLLKLRGARDELPKREVKDVIDHSVDQSPSPIRAPRSGKHGSGRTPERCLTYFAFFVMTAPMIVGFNLDYSGLDFCEAASQQIVKSLRCTKALSGEHAPCSTGD
jgi:hypothetical protein